MAMDTAVEMVTATATAMGTVTAETAEVEDGATAAHSPHGMLKGSKADGRSSDRCRRFTNRKFGFNSRVTRFASKSRPGSRNAGSRDLSNALGSNRR